jgi:Right handed beta helix region
MYKKLRLITFIIFSFCFTTNAQYGKILYKNLITDFGAKPNDTINDSDAFEQAANFINTNKKNITLLIPKGNYLIGKIQKKYYNPENLFHLTDCSNIKIIGEKGAKINYINYLFFGTFDSLYKKSPSNKHFYNPSNTENNKFHKTDATVYLRLQNYGMDIGNCFTFDFCENIEVKEIELYGNSKNFVLGGYWGLGNRPYERMHCGIFINCSKNITLNRCKISYFGTDGMIIASQLNADKENFTNGIKINNCVFTKSGRNNFSLIGGSNITVNNSEFSLAATEKIITNPCAGIDIEPELSKVTNVKFENCKIWGNAGCGVTDGYVIDTSIVFKNCTITNAKFYAVITGSTNATYENCTISGTVISKNSAIEFKSGTKFINCTFTDSVCKNGKCFVGMYLIGIVGIYQTFYGCNFYSKKAPLLYAIYDEKINKGYNSYEKCNFYSTSTFISPLGNASVFVTNAKILNCNFNFKKNNSPNFKNFNSNIWKNVYFNNLKIDDRWLEPL